MRPPCLQGAEDQGVVAGEGAMDRSAVLVGERDGRRQGSVGWEGASTLRVRSWQSRRCRKWGRGGLRHQGSWKRGRGRSCAAVTPSGRRRPRIISRAPRHQPRRAATSWPSWGRQQVGAPQRCPRVRAAAESRDGRVREGGMEGGGVPRGDGGGRTLPNVIFTEVVAKSRKSCRKAGWVEGRGVSLCLETRLSGLRGGRPRRCHPWPCPCVDCSLTRPSC